MAEGYTVPGMTEGEGHQVVDMLQSRLSSLIDLQLTLKHIHWNVVGSNFIGIHEMLDPQFEGVSLMVDEVAERIAALGGEPVGTPGYVAKNRTWDDYSLGRGGTMEHLGALDLVYVGVIKDHRKCIKQLEALDLVSQDVLLGQAGQLEKYHWFVRAHLENDKGHLSTGGQSTLQDAANAAHIASGERS